MSVKQAAPADTSRRGREPRNSAPSSSLIDLAALKRRIVAGLMGPWRMTPLILALAVIWTFFYIENSLFLSSQNLTNLLNQISVSSLIAIGLVFVLVVRQVDISLAALAAVGGAIAADLNVESHWNVVLAVTAALAAGVAVSLFHCWIIVKSRAPSFIVTLGGMFVLSALLLWMLPVEQAIVIVNTPLQAVAGTYLPDWLSYVLAGAAVCVFGSLRWSYHSARRREGMQSRALQSTILPTVALAVGAFGILVFVFNSYHGVPVPAVIVIGVAVTLTYIASQTPLGKHLYAIGGNPEAARRAGINVGLVTAIAFGVGGFLAATAGVVNASRSLGVSAQSSDLSLLLGALAAVVIGGVSLFGGRGSVWGAVLGGILVGSIENGLQLMSATVQVQWTVQGVVLVIAVVIDSSISRHSAGPG